MTPAGKIFATRKCISEIEYLNFQAEKHCSSGR